MKRILLIILCLSGFSLKVFSDDMNTFLLSPQRLIEVKEGKQEWVNEKSIHSISLKQHQAGKCAGFIDVTDYPDAKPLAQPFHAANILIDPKPKYGKIVNPLLEKLSAGNLYSFVESLSSFPNRFYKSQEGVKSSQWIKSKFEELAANRSDISVRFFSHKFSQSSVIARIEGRSPKLKEEVVVIGAHQDSINWKSEMNSFDAEDMDAPGADDDASGVATLLEVFRVLVESGYQPERSIEFMAYAGEELGLLGSQDISQSYKNENKKVVGVLQFDMTMYPGKEGKIQIIKDFTNNALTDFLIMLVDTYAKVPWTYMNCGYGCSDHAAWTRAGFASAFPFEASWSDVNKAIHTKEDKLHTLDSAFGLHFAKIGLAFAIEMGTEIGTVQ